MKCFYLALVLLLSVSSWAREQHAASGMVLKVDQAHKTILVSCDSIPGVMDAMTLPFDVHDPK